jgi:UDP-N-acetylmuramate: L-alanyl-gamma-D-glutamyl-meso-diaminopimelate ligase
VSFFARPLSLQDRLLVDHQSLVQNYFKHPSLKVIRDSSTLATELIGKSWHEANLLLMSSGTFDELDLKDLAGKMGLSII